ncbi:MAG: exodeoxyribonuclease VII large subunit [Clostridia bacterium]|nr:exodeoxyribonuclease VII large subunit [Clostridia bacterium]
MEKRIISVSELNEYIKLVLEHDELLMRVFVRGEISNFKNHYQTGHFYFSLKDAGGTVRAVMFRGNASRLKFVPENGMRVILGGRVGVFPRDGQYQIYVDTMEPDGVGALYVAYEQLKAKLSAEGLFAESRKKPLPALPMRIGVITSPTGAAIRDILNVLGRRFPLAEVVLYPALVQGENAAADLARGMRYFNEKANVDVIIIGRGGGSLEDLWAFNEEPLVRAVAASEIPVISAVGHETDFTLCDFAADRRAPTPSAAAELAVPDAEELSAALDGLSYRMNAVLSKKMSLYRERLQRLSSARVLTSPLHMIDDKRMALAMEERALYDRMTALISRKKTAFSSYENALSSRTETMLAKKRTAFAAHTAKLDALNPLSVVSRGYSAVFDEKGKLIKSVSQTERGKKISFMLTDGRVHATVDEIEENIENKEVNNHGRKEENDL